VERIYTDEDAKPEALKGATIAVIGYGSQGRAHARNLRDSGFNVIVGARPGGAAGKKAEADGFHVVSPADAAREAQLVALLTPDMSHREVYARDIEPNLSAGDTLLVAHNIDIAPRVAPLRIGDVVEYHGEYAWNPKGGVVHWTHRDPSGVHESGWLRHGGQTFQ